MLTFHAEGENTLNQPPAKLVTMFLLKFALLITLAVPGLAVAASITMYYPPTWAQKASKAKEISDVLRNGSGLDIQPRIAKSYPDILEAFASKNPSVVYVGSFVQAVMYSQGATVPLLQGVDGQEFYTAVLIAPKISGTDPVAIVKSAGAAIAYTKAASSGESGAKAASGGKASIAVDNHMAAANAVKVGHAKAAFVKNWWWEQNKDKFPELVALDYPGVSNVKNPDNILSVNKAVSSSDADKIKAAAKKMAAEFGVKSMTDFNGASLIPTVELMKKAKIDPSHYQW